MLPQPPLLGLLEALRRAACTAFRLLRRAVPRAAIRWLQRTRAGGRAPDQARIAGRFPRHLGPLSGFRV